MYRKKANSISNCVRKAIMLLLALSLLLCNMSYAATALANSKTTKGSYSLEPYTENDMKNSYKVEF